TTPAPTSAPSPAAGPVEAKPDEAEPAEATSTTGRAPVGGSERATRAEKRPQAGGAGHAPTRSPGAKPLASPAVRRRAWDLGIELQFVQGSGPAGRIEHQDLDAWLASRGAAVAGVASQAAAAMRGNRAAPDGREETIEVIG